MTKSDALIVIGRIESNILALKEEREKESLVLIEQMELLLVVLKAEIEKELPVVPEGPIVPEEQV